MRTSVATTIRVERNDVGHDIGNTRPEELGLPLPPARNGEDFPSGDVVSAAC